MTQKNDQVNIDLTSYGGWSPSPGRHGGEEGEEGGRLEQTPTPTTVPVLYFPPNAGFDIILQ